MPKNLSLDIAHVITGLEGREIAKRADLPETTYSKIRNGARVATSDEQARIVKAFAGTVVPAKLLFMEADAVTKALFNALPEHAQATISRQVLAESSRVTKASFDEMASRTRAALTTATPIMQELRRLTLAIAATPPGAEQERLLADYAVVWSRLQRGITELPAESQTGRITELGGR